MALFMACIVRLSYIGIRGSGITRVTLIQRIIEILLWPGRGSEWRLSCTRNVPGTLMEIYHLEEVGVELRIIYCMFRNSVF